MWDPARRSPFVRERQFSAHCPEFAQAQSTGSIRWQRQLPGLGINGLVPLPGGDFLWLISLRDRAVTVDGTTVEDGCGYRARIAAADGAASGIRPVCKCRTGSAVSDAAGDIYVADDGSVSALAN